jgi:uncharacterized membrane protein
MKALGILLVVLGVLAFLVPVPHREQHGVSIGDARFGVEIERREKLHPAVGIVLVAGGVVVLLMGSRK